MDVGALAVGEASFSVTGSGDISAAGRPQRTSAAVVGSGDLRLGGLETANATLSVAGSGDIGIRATETAAVELRGSGDVTVAGPARCTINKIGLGRRPLRRLSLPPVIATAAKRRSNPGRDGWIASLRSSNDAGAVEALSRILDAEHQASSPCCPRPGGRRPSPAGTANG